jgi:hypothetical protein
MFEGIGKNPKCSQFPRSYLHTRPNIYKSILDGMRFDPVFYSIFLNKYIMKKYLAPFVIVIAITSILLSSCGSSSSLVKRRYSKGYYYSHNKNRSNRNVQPEKTNVAVVKQPIIITPQFNQPSSTAAEHSVSAPEPITAAANSKITPDKIKTRSASKIFDVASPKNNSPRPELSLKKPIKLIDGILTQKHNGGAGDALSLLWIVIVVLLVLFLLGLIGEVLGGLIYILLVVALVLLILWLLRIL